MALVLGSPTASGEEPPAHRPSDLTLHATTRRADILVGEPLALDIALENRGSDRRDIWPLHSLADVSVTITDPSGISLRSLPVYLSLEAGWPRTVPLPPGAAYRKRFVVLYSGGLSRGDWGLAFPEPGDYSVSVLYPLPEDPENPMRAGPLSVHVRAAEGRDAEALSVMRAAARRWPFVPDADCGDDSPATVNLATEYADTPYGQCARFSLARARIWGGGSSVDKDQALSDLATLAKLAPPFPLADECLLEIGFDEMLTGKPEEAAARFASLLRDYPATPVAYESMVYLAVSHYTMGDREKALAILEEVKSRFVGVPGSRASLLASRLATPHAGAREQAAGSSATPP